MTGAPSPEYVAARRVLLDALDALAEQLDAIVLVGAQAIYMHTGEAAFAVAAYTTDADIALDPSALHDDPQLAEAMTSADFTLDPQQPGVWMGRSEIAVDLMVPGSMGGPGRRGARLGIHGKTVARKARGLEAALVDRAPTTIHALDPSDTRHFVVNVAGPAALLVAKLHKLSERRGAPERLEDKDALDVYRLLRAISTSDLAHGWQRLLADQRSADVARDAMTMLDELFGTTTALGNRMAARALTGLEDPQQMTAANVILAKDLLTAIGEAS